MTRPVRNERKLLWSLTNLIIRRFNPSTKRWAIFVPTNNRKKL